MVGADFELCCVLADIYVCLEGAGFRFRLGPVQACPHSLPIVRESSYFRSLYLSVQVMSLHF